VLGLSGAEEFRLQFLELVVYGSKLLRSNDEETRMGNADALPAFIGAEGSATFQAPAGTTVTRTHGERGTSKTLKKDVAAMGASTGTSRHNILRKQVCGTQTRKGGTSIIDALLVKRREHPLGNSRDYITGV
jgi:hypothetical protein